MRSVGFAGRGSVFGVGVVAESPGEGDAGGDEDDADDRQVAVSGRVAVVQQHTERVARNVEQVRPKSLGHIAEYDLNIPLSEPRTVHVIESRGEVLDRAYEGDRVQLRARLGSRQLAQLRAAGTQMTITPIADDGKACLAALDPKRGWRESEEGI